MKLFSFFLLMLLLIQYSEGSCILDEDWPEKPCWDTGSPSLEEKIEQWQRYYEYKGSEWMEIKKLEMNQALESGNLTDWVRGNYKEKNFTNSNVWYYYYLNGEAPDYLDGKYIVQKEFEGYLLSVGYIAAGIALFAGIVTPISYLINKRKKMNLIKNIGISIGIAIAIIIFGSIGTLLIYWIII